jgi:hypothetical protein
VGSKSHTNFSSKVVLDGVDSTRVTLFVTETILGTQLRYLLKLEIPIFDHLVTV